MIQYAVLRRTPRLLRWYRTRLTLDWKRLTSYLPTEGKVLDVGCGVGLVDYEVARARPKVKILGIDLSDEIIAMAQSYNATPNVEYKSVDLRCVEGQFDCILLVDVFHHVPPDERLALLEASSVLLSDRGYVLIKDIERNGGQISWFMDRVVSRAPEVYLQNCNELAAEVTQRLDVIKTEVHFRFPFPHSYIVAQSMAR